MLFFSCIFYHLRLWYAAQALPAGANSFAAARSQRSRPSMMEQMKELQSKTAEASIQDVILCATSEAAAEKK
jgi:hypothetical protein